MRCVGRILVSVAPVIAGAMAFGYEPGGWVAPARAQTGSLQVPAHTAPESPVKPPAAAPRQSVHQDGHVAKAATPPVVAARGPSHPHKPHAGTPPPAPAKPAPVEAPPPASPTTAPAAGTEKPQDAEKPDGSAGKLPRFAS